MKENQIEISNKIIELYSERKYSLRTIANKINRSTDFITKIIKDAGIYEFSDGTVSIKKENRFLPMDGVLYIAKCKMSGEEFGDVENKSGILTRHIVKLNPDFKLPTGYVRRNFFKKNGKFWYEEFFDILETSQDFITQIKKCKYCEWTTIDLENKSGAYTSHIKEVHDKTIQDYINDFPEEIVLFKTFNDRKIIQDFTNSLEENNIECKICGEKMRLITNTHLKNKHNISKKEYKLKFGNTISKITSEKLSLSTRKNNIILFGNKEKRTNIEILIENKLIEIGIDFKTQKEVNYWFYDFYLKDYNLFVEADGIYWHGHDRQSNWGVDIFKNVIKDFKKSEKVEKIVRLVEGVSINHINLNQISSKDSFFNYLSKENFDIKNHKIFNLKENEVIFSKEFCADKQEYFKEKSLSSDLMFLLKNFYSPEKHRNFIDLNTRISEESMLKGIFFEPFYMSSKKGNKNLFSLFKNDYNLNKVIQYRLGINNSKENFDISIKNLYRGIEVRNVFNVGILPVKQAKNIYEEYVKKQEIVYDPFSGWASRLLGMETLIKDLNCCYIGSDNNYSLLNGYSHIINDRFFEQKQNISLNITDSKIEQTNLFDKVDFVFTSPPFFNDEIYSENQEIHKTEEEWIKNLIEPVFKNCFNYLKDGKTIVIDMKELYLEKIEDCLKRVGFIFKERKAYKVNKSHYNKKEKNQYITIFEKP